MTVEELEIVVTAKVEQAVKEVMKLAPAIQEVVKQVQEAVTKINTKETQKKVKQVVMFAKKQAQDLKKSTENNEIAIKVTNKEAKKQMTQLEKEIDSLQKKITGRQVKLGVINPQIDQIVNDTRKEVTPAGVNPNSSVMDKTVDNALSKNKDFTALNAQAQKLYTEIETYNSLLDIAKTKMSQLKQETNSTATTQNKLGSFFSGFKSKLESTKPAFSKIGSMAKTVFNGIGNVVKGVGNGIKNAFKASHVQGGLKHILKYAGALLSIRGIYGLLRGSAQAWLSSQNAGAQQLSANIEYMKYALGSMFAPVIQFVTNLMYQLMRAIQSVAYALSGVNIFAKVTASSMKSTAGSAKQTSKSLSGIHSEINNVNDNNSGGGSGSGTNPNIDLSSMDNQMSPLAQKLYDFFKPLKESWDTYGPMVIGGFKNAISGIVASTSAMWSSVEQIITNGTVYEIIANILNSIGQIGQAWANAWNTDNNGTELIQNIADIIESITQAILNFTASEGFQNFCTGIMSALSGIVQVIKPVIQGFVEMIEKINEIVSSVIGDILKSIGDTLQFIGQNQTAVEILKAIGEAIAIITGAIILWNVAQAIANGLIGLFGILTSPITLIILAIVGVIALCIVYWEQIKTVVMNVVNSIIEFITNLWDKVSFVFEAIWDVISTILGFIWDLIATVFQAIWNIVSPIINAIWQIISVTFQTIWSILSSILNSIWNIFSQIFNWIWQLISKVFEGIWNVISPIINKIWETIKFVLGKIKEIWSTIWTTISTVVSNVWNGIWSTIKNVINSILGGIESFVNGTIRGINKLLSGISKVASAVGSLIGLGPINLQLNTISLPRLAKGGVLTQETAFIGGEYSGARSNPEIVTPQNIMYDTMRRALSDSSFNSNSEQPIRVQIYWGTNNVVDEIIDGINEKTRRNGKCAIKVT